MIIKTGYNHFINLNNYSDIIFQKHLATKYCFFGKEEYGTLILRNHHTKREIDVDKATYERVLEYCRNRSI